MNKLSGIWSCKIGKADQEKLPNGADWPMRQAVAEAFYKLTGEEPEFIFSGWNSELTEAEEACLERADKIREEQRNAFFLYVEYDGGIDRDKDKAIEKVVGREDAASGCCLYGDCTRDLQFNFSTEESMLDARDRLFSACLGVRIRVS